MVDTLVADRSVERRATGAVDVPELPPVDRGPSRAPTAATRPPRRIRVDPVPWMIGALAFVLRMAFAAKGPTDWDSAQYLAGLSGFDVTHGRPQPPGYFLYVVAGNIGHALFGLSGVTSLVVVAAVASAAAAGLTTVAGRDLGGRFTGTAAGLLMATCPFVWFSGSIVATYSFDALGCALLIILAWRARPGSWHGVGAAVALGLLVGCRQSMIESFLLLALVAVAASTRTWRRLVETVAAGAAAVAVWLVPMAFAQPGGLAAWLRATRIETDGAWRGTSYLDNAPAAHENLGLFAAYTTVVLAPLAVLAVVAVAGLGVRRLLTGRSGRPATEPQEWLRPWYQGRAAILLAAIVPPVLIVSLLEFGKAGYMLAYLPAAFIALLLPVGALVRRPPSPGAHSPSRGSAYSPVWLALLTVAVASMAVVNVQRFVAGTGVLPNGLVTTDGSGLWLQQTMYEAPFNTTAATIRTADAADSGLAALGPVVRPDRDVVVMTTWAGGATYYRNAGWALPGMRIGLVDGGTYLYNELGGSLYYNPGTSIEVGGGGAVVLLAPPTLPGLHALVTSGVAVPVRLPRPIPGFLGYRVRPGADIYGVAVVAKGGNRYLGTGI